jgi:hypothetical protein
MLALMLGGLALTTTGFYLALRRIRKDIALLSRFIARRKPALAKKGNPVVDRAHGNALADSKVKGAMISVNGHRTPRAAESSTSGSPSAAPSRLRVGSRVDFEHSRFSDFCNRIGQLRPPSGSEFPSNRRGGSWTAGAVVADCARLSRGRQNSEIRDYVGNSPAEPGSGQCRGRSLPLNHTRAACSLEATGIRSAANAGKGSNARFGMPMPL